MEANLRIDNAVVDGAGFIQDITVNGQNLTAGAEIQNNKAVTINAANYSAPVEVTPSSGKDAMKKVTVTLEDTGAVLHAWTTDGNDTVYLNIGVAPETETFAEKSIKELDLTVPEVDYLLQSADDEYAKTSDTEFSVTFDGDTPTTVTYTRDAQNDISLW